MTASPGGVIFAKCEDEDGHMTLFTCAADARMELYRKVDRLLVCVTGKSFQFLSELNDLQSDDDDDGKTVFESKSDIPLRIVNLVLAPYNIVIEED